MKKIFLFILLFNFHSYSQEIAIVPKTGTIVFVKEEKILDKDLYIKSMKAVMPKMKKAMEQQIVFERLSEGKPTDTVQLKLETDKIAQNLEMMLPFLLEEKKRNIKFYNEFNGDIITKYYTVDEELIKNKIIINQATFEVSGENNEYVEIEKNEIIKLTEFKNETKTIKGYNCYKVIYTYDVPQNSDFDFTSSIITPTRELWVTEVVKCNYHPVINENEILEKYYPLEIIEYSDDIKGFVTTYTLDKFNIR